MKKENNFVYVVRENENINTIAKKTGFSAIKILIENNISPLEIRENVVLFFNFL